VPICLPDSASRWKLMKKKTDGVFGRQPSSYVFYLFIVLN
jgi:hypothetical protein